MDNNNRLLPMKNFTIFLVSLLCVACASARQVTPLENTHVEVRTETVFQKDTVYLELPLLVEKVQTLDTMSVLENRYAKSEAIVADGVLVHSLATKPVKEPIEVETKVVYRDSLVYVDKIVKETVEVAKPLSGPNRFFLAFGKWAFVILLGIGFWKLFKLTHLSK
ncbi:MAG: hypothetical protein MR330_08240 [Rikenellaceae bacterium]|nr:hypothetical protein [Rikenellaceae bacterium]